ncbi:MAG: transposase [Verrucomicrobiae bacterium]|nr:transposase [Verrucomicrobiae bacterium]
MDSPEPSDSDDALTGFPRRKTLPHDVPWWIPRESIYFITINTLPPGKPQLCRDSEPHPIASAILHAAQFYHENGKWYLHLLVVMPDHLHLLVSFPPEAEMKSTITKWKHYLARTQNIVWQRDFFDHRLRHDESFAEKVTYLRMNPVRKNLCQNPENWPHVLDHLKDNR